MDPMLALSLVAIVAVVAITSISGRDQVARDVVRALVSFFRRKK